MDVMSVSVIIPSYNSAEVVGDAVESALNQSTPPGEIIVVDDGSTDETRTTIGRYGPKVRYIYQNNQGVAAARNRGIREARGEFVAFLDADDVWHPCKLERQVDVMSQFPELVLLGTDSVSWPTEGFSTPSGSPVLQLVSFERMVVRNHLLTSSLIARRKALDQAGEFDVRLQGPEDYDMWLRIARFGELGNLRERLIGYRETPGSLSKHAHRMQAGMRLILEKLEASGTFANRRLLRRKAFAYFHFSCGYMHHAAGNKREAVANMLQSLLYYPFFYGRGVMKYRFARLRLFRRTLWSWLRGVPRF
jgi:glycosyltransferase involved in cell wall biosynthesis